MPDTAILTDTKKALGFDSGYTAFDLDITMHINSTLFTLQQLGVGPVDGLLIEPTTPWSELTSDNHILGAVKTYVYLKVRSLFDPPATSFALDAIAKQIAELEWRINVQVENERVSLGGFVPEVLIP